MYCLFKVDEEIPNHCFVFFRWMMRLRLVSSASSTVMAGSSLTRTRTSHSTRPTQAPTPSVLYVTWRQTPLTPLGSAPDLRVRRSGAFGAFPEPPTLPFHTTVSVHLSTLLIIVWCLHCLLNTHFCILCCWVDLQNEVLIKL